MHVIVDGKYKQNLKYQFDEVEKKWESNQTWEA